MAVPLIATMVLQAVAAIRQGNAAEAAGDYNKAVLDQKAAQENAQATARQELQGQQARQVIGQQLAAGAESGVGLGGSRMDLLNQSLFNAELDSLNIRYQGDVSASALKAQGKIEAWQGDQAQQAGYLNAATSLLSAASQYGGSPSYNYNNDASGMTHSATGSAIRGRR